MEFAFTITNLVINIVQLLIMVYVVIFLVPKAKQCLGSKLNNGTASTGPYP